MRDGLSKAAKKSSKRKTTADIFADLKRKVSKVTGETSKFKDLNQVDFHNKLGQFNGYRAIYGSCPKRTNMIWPMK